jgi:predicted transcriptional regulator
MSPVKESVIRLVESLPDDCTIEDIQYHLYVRDKVLRGSRAIDEGRVQSHEEVGRRLDQWAASYGLTRQ